MADRDEIDWIKENEPWRLNGKVAVPLAVPDSDWPNKLTKIKGIGKSIVKDISRIYDTEGELVEALLTGKVPLRDDKVDLLRTYYNIKGGK